MRSGTSVVLLLLLAAALPCTTAKKPSRPVRSSSRRSSSSRPVVVDEYDDDDAYEPAPPSRRSSRKPPAESLARAPRKRPVVYEEEEDGYEDEDDDDEYDPRPRRSSSRRPPSSRTRGPPSRGHRVVPYKPSATDTFTKGLAALRSSLPDPSTVKDAVGASFKAARETTSGLSANLYRDIKGLTSSELEQVMLKATRPDDTPVKGKHVERLVGVTYQISGRYDIYDAVLRKLWAKMAEKDWRTTIKALYILHRFAADGAPEHAPALKARLRELRRTRDPKRKDKYFNSKQLLAGDANAENIKFRAFLSRYAHYVLLRAQCFGGLFDEIAQEPASDSKKKKGKPATSTCLRTEHLEAAEMLLKAGIACQLKDGEACENTAIAAERVASDLIGLTTAVAKALNRVLKTEDSDSSSDAALIHKWCTFYSQDLLPQTKRMVQKTSSQLDAYGLYLPSRMGASVAPELLERGMSVGVEVAGGAEKVEEEVVEEEEEDEPAQTTQTQTAETVDEDEYEYDEEEYYDDDEL